VVAKRPRHPVGWLMTALGLVGLGAAAAQNYAYSAFRAHGGQRPGAGAAAWAGEVPWGLMLALFVLLVIVFPTGRPPTRRWAPLAWAVIVLGLTNAALAAAMYWPERHRIVAIDVYEEGVDGIYVVVPIGFMLIGICLLGAAVSFVVRYRRSTGVERAQLKWFAFASVVSPLILLEPLLRDGFGITSPLIATLGPLGFLTIPLAAGLGVLRYRLYDIDRVVSRTVSYAVLTGVLVAVYAGGIFVISPLVAGLGGGSELAVAASTLAVAAAFGPVRRRVQDAVDRRFNRARYDAQSTVEAFSAGLRDEVDLGELHGILLHAVHQSVAPQSADLWLRPMPGARRP
jgi:hypothetical protein